MIKLDQQNVSEKETCFYVIENEYQGFPRRSVHQDKLFNILDCDATEDMDWETLT